MSERNGWGKGVLGQLCSIEIGGTPSRNIPAYWDTDKSTDNLWVSIKDLNQRVVCSTLERITNAGVSHSNVKLQKPGTVLLSFKLTIGRVAFAGRPLYTNEAIAGLQSDSLDLKFLYHGLQQWDLLKAVDQAIKGATLNKAKLRKIVFDYPTSPKEQSTIAEILSTVDLAIEQKEGLIAKQQRIKTGLMQDLLTRGIDEQGNLRSEQTHQFKDSPLGRIPVEWDVVELGSLTEIPESITYGVLKPGPYVEGGIPLLQIEDVIHGDIDIAQLHRIGPELDAQYKRTRLQGGEIVVSLVGTIGRIAHLPLAMRGANLHRNLALVRIVEPHSSRFVFHYLRSETGQQEFANNSLGSTQALFNLGSLRALRVPQPDPDEQHRIAERSDASDSIISENTIAKQKLVALKTALMQDLLTGEKRVTPLLEPAVTT